MNGAKCANVACTVDLYLSDISEEHPAIKSNLPSDPDDGDQFLESNKRNIEIIDDFFVNNTVRSKHFRDNLEIYIARAFVEIFDIDFCDALRQKLLSMNSCYRQKSSLTSCWQKPIPATPRP